MSVRRSARTPSEELLGLPEAWLGRGCFCGRAETSALRQHTRPAGSRLSSSLTVAVMAATDTSSFRVHRTDTTECRDLHTLGNTRGPRSGRRQTVPGRQSVPGLREDQTFVT